MSTNEEKDLTLTEDEKSDLSATRVKLNELHASCWDLHRQRRPLLERAEALKSEIDEMDRQIDDITQRVTAQCAKLLASRGLTNHLVDMKSMTIVEKKKRG